jgi:hypothetical protein
VYSRLFEAVIEPAVIIMLCGPRAGASIVTKRTMFALTTHHDLVLCLFCDNPATHLRLPSGPRNIPVASVLSPPKEFQMRIIFLVLIGSILSILAFKYMDQSIGGNQLMASPGQLAAKS